MQSALPKLPVPLLDATLAKYERNLAPLLSQTELDKVRRIIEQFKDGLGPKLQLYLENKRESDVNWVSFELIIEAKRLFQGAP